MNTALAPCPLGLTRRWQGRDIAAFVFDIDGTLDDGTKGNIHTPVIPRMAEWLERGTNLVFVTNRPTTWVWRKVLVPIVAQASTTPKGRVFAACEQGAVIAELVVTDDAIRLVPRKSWPLQDRVSVEEIVQQAISHGYLQGRLREGLQFQVCVEELGELKAEVAELFPDSVRNEVHILRTRSTLTLYSRKAGKDIAVRYLQWAHPDLWQGHVLGFGDDADEFARVLPVLDVDKDRRDLFRKNGLNGVPAHRPDALQCLGFPILQMSPEIETEITRGTGYATAAYLAAFSAAVDPSSF